MLDPQSLSDVWLQVKRSGPLHQSQGPDNKRAGEARDTASLWVPAPLGRLQGPWAVTKPGHPLSSTQGPCTSPGSESAKQHKTQHHQEGTATSYAAAPPTTPPPQLPAPEHGSSR